MRLRVYLINRIVVLSIVCLFFIGTAQAATFTVDSTLDGSDATPGNGVCATAIGNCTLRAAIEEANASFGSDTIAFNIPGAGVKTISPASAYPTITGTVIIDGWTQGGVGYNGPPLIELDGTNTGGFSDGLTIQAGNSTLRGLIINNFGDDGVVLNGSSNVISSCYIGTDASGTLDLGNGNSGVNVLGSNNTVGGNTAAERNVISGNRSTGIDINSGFTGNSIVGNYIGTDADGASGLGNASLGVRILGDNNTVGGNTAGERNVISGNGRIFNDGYGIYILAGTGNLIIGNYIGTNASGTPGFDLDNGKGGVLIFGTDNRIGGTAAGDDNVISGKVIIIDGTGNSIRRNSMFSIIDLEDDGLTLNDPDDPDSGANNKQNFPVLAEAVNQSGNTNIEGSLNSTPNTPFKIEFFSSSSCNSSGYGAGETYLGTTTATTGAGGNIAFSYTPPSLVPFGRFITTTATRDVAPLDTSEFSECVQVVNPNAFEVTNTNDAGAGSLRKAILDANLIIGTDRITFNIISGPAVKTIDLLSPLPTITDAVIINGKTQPGFVDMPLIELNGTNAGTGADGLNITAGGSTIRGLIINRFGGDGIRLASLGGSTLTGNFIGTDSSGTIDLGNTNNGININASENNIIGGANPLARNLISGNNLNGIRIFNTPEIGNQIVGNIIGTDITRGVALGNSENGIDVSGLSSFVIIGGSTPELGNLISANGANGIRFASTSRSQVKGNLIGTDGSGTADLGNVLTGVRLGPNSNHNAIGDTAGGGNTIAFNETGVNVADTAIGDKISGNSIFSNDNLGIDLAPNGVTPNDLDDTDTGANNLQNFPELAIAFNQGGSTTIQGSLNSTRNRSFTIEFFSNTACDSSGNGEGQTFIGSTSVTTDSGGDIAFSFSPANQVLLGRFITATTTRNAEPFDTSEFSECAAVVPGPGNLTFSSAAYAVGEGAGLKTITVNRTDTSNGTITVDYATSNGTATAGQDYTVTSGTLTFLNAETVKTFDIPITNDSTDETGETINLNLSNPSPGVSITPNPTAVLTITDNDNPPTISITDVSLEEGNIGTNQFTFTVQLSAASSFPITVDYSTANGTATLNSDYLPTNGQLNFAAGETSKTISVTVLGDLVVELNETFFVNLSNPVNATFGDNQGLGTVLDDDNPGRFSFGLTPYSGVENTSVLVTVSRTNGDAGTVTVDYATSGGTATPSVDYASAFGTLIFNDGELTKTFLVNLLHDVLPEPTENFNVVLSNPIGGAILGTPAVAAVNILDDDSGTLLTIGGEVKLADNTPVANVTMTLQGASSAATTTDNLGQYSFPNLAPNGNYSVTPSSIGFTFTPINRQYNNLSADVTNANFTAAPSPSRQLRIIGGNATPTQNITVNVELVAQGDENSAGFSLNYDSAILTNPTAVLGTDALTGFLTVNNAQAGKYGVLLALPAGNSFAAGTRQIVTVTFNTLPTAAYSSPVTFGDIPIVRQVVNSNADPLPANYLDGAVTFAQGYEADVAPRPTGNNNGSITISDFTQVGRFVAGLDTLNPGFNEFQRADSSPRATLGNGSLSVSDYTQAGRYAAGIDAAALTGGQSAPSLIGQFVHAKDLENLLVVPTAIRVVNAQAGPNTQVLVSMETDAQGAENGFGFTLNYDQTKLSNPLVTIGSGIPAGSTLISNTLQAGRVGVVLGLPFNVGLTAGTKQLVTIRFDVAANAPGGNSTLVLGDTPVFREVSDVNANVLASSFQNGAINILAPTAATAAISGRVTTADGQPIRNVTLTLSGGNPAETKYARTNSFGYYGFQDLGVGQTFVLSAAAKKYTFSNPDRLINLYEDITDADFVGDGK